MHRSESPAALVLSPSRSRTIQGWLLLLRAAAALCRFPGGRNC
jgi:hypothetical protein